MPLKKSGNFRPRQEHYHQQARHKTPKFPPTGSSPVDD